MVKTIYVSKVMSDDEISDKEGEYFDENTYNMILDDDVDVYRKEDGKLLLKLRKNCIDQNICKSKI